MELFKQFSCRLFFYVACNLFPDTVDEVKNKNTTPLDRLAVWGIIQTEKYGPNSITELYSSHPVMKTLRAMECQPKSEDLLQDLTTLVILLGIYILLRDLFSCGKNTQENPRAALRQ